ncbi:hypothetical protein A3Q56_05520 [Intoshia linei]|uniref:Uncharacterized protein n=1 Tax=Intoshia linei TaxID=1819745 RepID=A0A177AXN2_9BILA|nr:hypothetical protein A3Q56_05520 [Intoshia linei]
MESQKGICIKHSSCGVEMRVLRGINNEIKSGITRLNEIDEIINAQMGVVID